VKPGVLLAALLAGSVLRTLPAQAAKPSLSYDVPAGWSRAEDPNTGVVSLSPRGLPQGSVCILLVFPAVAATQPPDEFHLNALREAAASGKLLDAQPAGTVGAFQVGMLRVQMANGLPFTFRIYSSRWADRGQIFGLSASSPEIAERFRPVLDAMMSRISVPGAAMPARAAPTPAPKGPAVSGKGALAGVYVTLKAKGGFNFGASKDYITLFPDGRAYWHFPDEGLLGFDVDQEERESPDFFGRYEVTGDEVAIHWATGPQYGGKRQRNGILLLNGYGYVPISSGPDGQTLSGTYRPDNTKTSDCCDVTFHPDGRFEDRGVRTVAGALDLAYGRAKVPVGPGTGRYRIAQDSIVFEYDDGRREQLSFYIPDADGSKAPPLLVIHTYSIVRLR